MLSQTIKRFTDNVLRCSRRYSLKLSKVSDDTICYLAHALNICMRDKNVPADLLFGYFYYCNL